VNQKKLLEDLTEIGKVLLDLEKKEAESIEKELGCSIKGDCKKYGLQSNCDESYKTEKKEKKPITLQERYFSCLAYRDYVIEEVKRGTRIETDDLDYIVTSLLSFIPPVILSNYSGTYGNSISKVILKGLKSRNLKKEMDGYSRELINTIKIITDGKKIEISKWYLLEHNQSYEISIDGKNKRYRFNSEKMIRNIEEHVKNLTENLVENLKKTSKPEIRKMFINQISEYLENLEIQEFLNPLPSYEITQYKSKIPVISSNNIDNILIKDIIHT